MLSYRQPWMNTAYSRLGTKERPGPRSNADILLWAKESRIPSYTTDSIPWCGLFVAWVFVHNGIEPSKVPLRALDWLNFGTELEEPAFGAVMCFTRRGGGHVGFAVKEDDRFYWVLGGNQADKVSIARVAKSRLAGVRWPPGMKKFYKPGLEYVN